jgi:hypothetical protein
MNTPIIAQIAITLVALMAIYRVFQRYQQGAMPLAEAIGWKVAWLAVAVIFWQPELASWVAATVGIGRGADLVTYAAVLFLLWTSFRLSVRLDRLERNLTKVVRHRALDDADGKRDA